MDTLYGIEEIFCLIQERWGLNVSPPFLPLNTSLTSSVLLTQLKKLQHSTEPVNSAVSVCSQRLEFISLLISHFESHLAGKNKAVIGTHCHKWPPQLTCR